MLVAVWRAGAETYTECILPQSIVETAAAEIGRGRVLGMSGIQRDAGLVRAMGPWSLAANLITIVIGAGIFAAPGALAACVGPYAPLAFLVCGVAIGSVALCFAEGGSRIPTSGGPYGYIEAAFGPLIGCVNGLLLWSSATLAPSGVAAALADMVVTLLPAQIRTAAHVAVIAGVVSVIALINLRGVTHGSRLINIMTVLKLIPLVLFACVGVWAIHRANFVPQSHPNSKELGRALFLAMFASCGMESGLIASGEVSQPARTIPRALGIAIGTVIVLYIAIQTVAQGILGNSLAHSVTPLADAMARINPRLRVLLLAGAGVSMLGSISGAILAGPRMVFAFARAGLFPRALGRVNTRSHVPNGAIMVCAALVIVLASTGTFAELAVLATLGIAVVYIFGCAAAWQLARKGVADAGTPLNLRWLGTAMVIGIASMLSMIALASRVEILGLLAFAGASAVVFLASKRFGAEKRAAETPVA